MRPRAAPRADPRERRGPSTGACTFAEDPRLAAPDARLIWRAELDPSTLSVVALRDPGRSSDSFDPGRFGSWLAIARDADGCEHAVLSDGYHRIRIEVERGSLADGHPVLLHFRLPGVASADARILPLRQFLELCRTGRFATALFPPDRRVTRWLTVLRVHDALSAGASQREIAAVLFGEERVAVDWRGRSDSLRSQVRRLVREARAIAAGGYRQLLRVRRAR
jgi:hypothetical protein